MRLNPQQREAVEHTDGPVLVLAGAGSGKTRVITSRIARLVDRGVRPNNILGVTFTNKAAGEMRERVAQTLGAVSAAKVHLSTFHALGARILREDIEELGYDKRFTIVDTSDQRRIMKNVLDELNLSGTKSSDRGLLSIISRAKTEMTTPARLPGAKFNPEMPRAQRVFDLYNTALKNLNAVDFDDLLGLPTRLLEERGDIRQKYRERFRYVMVDEYQDTNALQLRMLKTLIGPPHNLMVVGDDDQSIYGFRGAVADNILAFDKAFPGAKIITLEQNYRSVSSILNAANAVIANNSVRRAKHLWSELGQGKPIRSFELVSDAEEASFIARRILAQARAQERPFDHFAILYRTNPQARVLEEALRQYRVPYRIVGGQSLFDKKEVKDVISYLKLIVHPFDEMANRRVINVPSRGIGTSSIAKIDGSARSSGAGFAKTIRGSMVLTLPDKAQQGIRSFVGLVERYRRRLRETSTDELPRLLHDLLEDLGLERAIRASERNPKIAEVRWRIVLEMIERIPTEDYRTAFAALDEYVRAVALDPPGSSKESEGRNQVTLMTFHSSKGLEFPVVYMAGMVEGILPHRNSVEEHNVSEERRLCYVGMTRAKEDLILTRARYAFKRRERIVRKPSRFLDEIPAELIREGAQEAPEEDKEEQLEKSIGSFEAIKALLAGGGS